MRHHNDLWRGRSHISPQPDRPQTVAYLLRVRNSREQQRNTWAADVREARERAPMSQSELARRLRVDRVTVYRWETGRQRPEDPAVVRRVATVLGVDAEEALAASGFLLDVEPPTKPASPPDPEIERIRTSRLNPAQKNALIKHVQERQRREQQTRLAELDMIIRAQERER